MIVFGIALFALVPTSVWVTQKIDNSSNVSVEQRLEESSKKAEQIAKKAKKETSENILDKIGNAITNGMDNTINSAKTYTCHIFPTLFPDDYMYFQIDLYIST